MNNPTMDNVVQRLDRLERENRRIKLVGVLVLLGVVAVVVMGQATATRVAKVIEAEAIILRDENGKRRISLGVLQGKAILLLHDEDEKIRSALVANRDAVVLEFRRKSVSVLHLSSINDETGLDIFDSNKKRRVSLRMQHKEGMPSIAILDAREKPSIYFQELKGSGSLNFFREGDQKSSLNFYGSVDSVRVQLYSSKDTSGIAFRDKYGTKRAVLGLFKGEPKIGFLDEQGRPGWVQ